ncbi:unnamed protein product [Cylindrotheca closterium]|uniref:Uncharacterized protein n=1 Tax=Cylindrotheca closterium TaxID=2856 RepID=A0AAD2PWU9_9STRA|nr:unnamed protein product [Cylindrotheca closterium]
MSKEPSRANKRLGSSPTQSESGSQVEERASKKQFVEVPQEEYDRLLLAEKEMKELQKRLKEAEERRKEAEERRKEVEEKYKALEALETGEYYTSYNDLWDINLVECKPDHLDALTRTKPPSIERNGIKYYQRTLELASDETGDYVVAEQREDARSEESSSGSDTKADTWPFDVLASTLGEDGMLPLHQISGSHVVMLHTSYQLGKFLRHCIPMWHRWCLG